MEPTDEIAQAVPTPDAQAVPTAEALGLRFRAEDSTGALWVHYEPVANAPVLQPEQLPQVLESAGFQTDEQPLEPAAVSRLLEQMQRGEACDLCLLGPVDARVEVFTNKDEMLAGVVVHPPQGGGADLTDEALDQALKRAQIIHGLLEDSLTALTSEALQQQLRESLIPVCMIVAYGEPVRHGSDARLEPLIETIVDRRPQVDESGKVDFLELGDFPHVEAGEALVRRHPPSEGTPGRTVTGHLLKARSGKERTLKPKNDSVALAPDDDNLLVAATSGMPVLARDGAYVEKVLHLEQVGLSTGHIRFDGSVHVKGNVEPGMKIEVMGDVKVGGLVEAAHIRAGGAIEVSGGVIGRRQLHEDAHSDHHKDNRGTGPVDDAYLKAGTQLKARFIQEAKVESDQEVIVQKQVFHSEINAGTRFAILGRGAIVGGRACAGELIDVGVSGAMSNVATVLVAGATDEIKKRVVAANDELKQVGAQRQQLMSIVERFVKQHKPITGERKQKFLEARESLNKKEQALREELAELKAAFQRCQKARIQIRHRCHAGTLIKLAGHEASPRKDLSRVTFAMQDGAIVMR
jgi:uncharacterized protein (DUF342 family)